MANSNAQRRSSATFKRYIEHSEQSTYIEVPFQMPEQVEEIHVRYQVETYSRESAAVIDLGVRDSVRVRGWSGGARQEFNIAQSQATRVICQEHWLRANGPYFIMPTRYRKKAAR